MKPLWIFFIQRKAFTYLLVIVLTLFGILSAITIPKESAPEVRIPVGIVSTLLPGASAEDVEELVTNTLEDGLGNLEDVNKITSTSRESLSVITVEFSSNADIDSSIRALKDEIDTITPDLPRDAEDPVVSEVNFADQPILITSISGDRSPREMNDLAETLERELKRVKGISRVESSGVPDREVQVIIDQQALELYNLTLGEVVGTLGSANASLPVGTITQDGIEYAIKFEGDINEPEEIKDIIVSRQGGARNNPIYIRDIAFVSDGIEKSTSFSRASEDGNVAQPALTLSLFKQSGGDISQMAREAREKLAELQDGGVLAGMTVVTIFDQGELVRDDLVSLTKTGLTTTTLVILTLLLTIGWREALVAALSIPLSFLIAFIGLKASGNTINFVSLFSLILAIGILVDSGIVVTEAINARVKKYGSKKAAAFASINEYAWPLIAGTMTTVAVFAPLFFISGTTGKFIATIPFTVIFVLLASLFVALGIIPLIAILFTKSEDNRLEGLQREYTDRLKVRYRAFLEKFFANRRHQNRFLFGLVGLFIAIFFLPAFGLLKVTFFPGEDSDFIYVEVEKQQGTTLTQTDFAVRVAEEILYETPEIESFVTTIGQSSTFNAGTLDPKFANITINLNDERAKSSDEIIADLRAAFSPITTAEFRVITPDSGPPTGTPILIKFLGDDLGNLDRAAEEGEKLLASIEGTVDITTSTKENGTQFVITLDKGKATALGLSAADVAQTLRTAIVGTTATKINKQNNDIDVVVKSALNPTYTDAHSTNEVSIEAIESLAIATPQGSVLLGSLIEVSVEKSNNVIRHENEERIATIGSYVLPGFNLREIVAEFSDRADDELELPAGVRIAVGGENEENDQSFIEMFYALIAGIVLMFTILILEFNSWRYPLFLITTIPLSLIGVFVGLTVTGQTLSFPSILGVIALSGVIINHAIILLDSMLLLRRKQPELSLHDVVIESASIRLRPILLTTVTTIIGLIPLTYASAIWGPLAFAIMFGLGFASILTLVFIPLLFYRWPGKFEEEETPIP